MPVTLWRPPAAASSIGRTAGSYSWRAWAGRPTGDGAYASGDASRSLVRGLAWGWRSLTASTPSECPVCADAPECADDWHRLWCGCHVCGECVRQWARAVLDKAEGLVLPEGSEEQLVTLSCPACAAQLLP